MAQDTYTHYDLLETIPQFDSQQESNMSIREGDRKVATLSHPQSADISFHDYVSQWWGSLKHIRTEYELRKYNGCCDVCATEVGR